MIGGEGLNVKKGQTLTKYVYRGFEMLAEKDQKTVAVVNYNLLLKLLQKLHERYGACAILKSGFEKHPVCWTESVFSLKILLISC